MFSELRSFVLIGFGGRLSELAHISVRLAHISVRTRPRSRLVRNRAVVRRKDCFRTQLESVTTMAARDLRGSTTGADQGSKSHPVRLPSCHPPWPSVQKITELGR